MLPVPTPAIGWQSIIMRAELALDAYHPVGVPAVHE
jgi:hypothetical protein